MSRTRNAHAEVRAVRDEYINARRYAREQIASGRYTPLAATEYLDTARTNGRWRERLTQAQATVDTYLTSATTARDQIKQKLTGPVDGTTPEVFELAATRAWNRHRATLDSLTEVGAYQRALDLVRTTTGNERAALLQELGAYLESRGADPDDVARALDNALVAGDDTYADASMYADHANRVAAEVKTAAETLAGVIDYDPRHSDRVPEGAWVPDSTTAYKDPDGLDDLLTFVTTTDSGAPIPPVPHAKAVGGRAYDPHEDAWVAGGVEVDGPDGLELALLRSAEASHHVADTAAGLADALRGAFAEEQAIDALREPAHEPA